MRQLSFLACAMLAAATVRGVEIVDLAEAARAQRGVTATASSTSNATYTAQKAFDGDWFKDSNNSWRSAPGGGLDQWLVCQFTDAFESGKSVRVLSYSIYYDKGWCGDGTATYPRKLPKTWTFEGSNDGETWTTLDSHENWNGWTAYQWHTFNAVGSVGCYRYYRLHMTAICNSNAAHQYYVIPEMRLYGIVADTEAEAVSMRVWKSAAGNWNEASKWTEGAAGQTVPAAGESVIIPAGSTVALSESTPRHASVAVAGTIVMTNWATRLEADAITVSSGGNLTCAGPFSETEMSNRVWVACNDFTLKSGGKVDVTGKGYGSPTNSTVAYGPGKGVFDCGGGAHGGFGASGTPSTQSYSNGYTGNGETYGSVEEPATPGSTGKSRGAYGALAAKGGGVVRIDASGTVTLNGSISANGSDGAASHGGSSGGSILVHASKIAADGGSLSAGGGNGQYGDSGHFGHPGGGGRIAIHYNAAAQSAEDLVALAVSAGAGKKHVDNGGAKPWNYGTLANNADIGTVYFTDAKPLKFLGTSLTGQLHFGSGVTAYTTGSLAMTNGWARFANEGFTVTVNGDLSVSGTDTRLEMGGGTFLGAMHGTLARLVSGSTPWTLSVGGDMTITNGAWVSAYPASTNGADKVGGMIAVAGDLSISGANSSCTPSLYVGCCPTNGAAVKVTARNVTIADDALVSSSFRGFAINRGPGKGKDSSASAANSNATVGSGHGGRGHGTDESCGKTYGDANRPTLPGSGGGYNNYMWEIVKAPVSGGGVVHLVAKQMMTVNGRVEADAFNTYPSVGSACRVHCGSGGSVLLECRNLVMGANARVSAEGGNMQNGSATFVNGGVGGGGRIAVYTGEPYIEGETSARRVAVTSEKPVEYLGTFSAAGGLWKDANNAYRKYDETGGWQITTDPGEATVRGGDGTVRFCFVRKKKGLVVIFQ